MQSPIVAVLHDIGFPRVEIAVSSNLYRSSRDPESLDYNTELGLLVGSNHYNSLKAASSGSDLEQIYNGNDELNVEDTFGPNDQVFPAYENNPCNGLVYHTCIFVFHRLESLPNSWIPLFLIINFLKDIF